MENNEIRESKLEKYIVSIFRKIHRRLRDNHIEMTPEMHDVSDRLRIIGSIGIPADEAVENFKRNIADLRMLESGAVIHSGGRIYPKKHGHHNYYGIRLFRTKSALSAACDFIRSLDLPEDELPIALGSWENIAGDN